MPIDLTILSRHLEPARTVLLLGAGSSIPSGGLSGAQLAERIASEFAIEYDASLYLSDIATIVEKRVGRPALITFVRKSIEPLYPTGSLLNLPLFPWKTVYTTNYDTLIERAYGRARRDLVVYRSNFDFSIRGHELATRLLKLHGSIEEDVVDGKNSRIILTNKDYEVTSEYRESLYDSLRLDVSHSNLLIIGHSLSDPDLKNVVDEALRRKRESVTPGRIYLLAYSGTRDRALLASRLSVPTSSRCSMAGRRRTATLHPATHSHATRRTR
jgi:SIR2-like domain